MQISKIAKIIIVIALVAIVGVGYFFNRRAVAPTSGSSDQLAASVAQAPVVATPPADPIQVPVLTYHTIAPKTDKKEGVMQKHYHIVPEKFEAQMKYLADNGYTPIRFDAYANYLMGKGTIPEKSVVLTFDDGWKNQYEYAVPILKKYGFTATFFILSKLRTAGYMSWDEIRALDAAGFEIASHTATHPKLPLIEESENLLAEVAGSKETIEREVGHGITTIAYPYYQHNESVRAQVQSAGYTAARGGWGKFKNSIDHIYEITSQEAVNNDNPFASKAQ